MKLHSKFMLLAVFMALMLCGCGKEDNNISNYDLQLVAEISDNNYGESSLYRDINSDIILEVKDNKIVNKYASNTSVDTAKLLELNEDCEGVDITINSEYLNSTWKSDMNSSSEYIKYLKDNGYEVLRSIKTQKFIDIYLSNNIETKRVLIGVDTITVKNAELQEIKIQNYVEQQEEIET